MTLHARVLDDAVAILASAVQQRLVPASSLHAEITARPTTRWRKDLLAVCGDLTGGSHSVIELEAMRLLRRFGLPEPSRQTRLLLPDGLARVDCYWEEPRVVVELDGRMHMEVSQWRADLSRQNELALAGSTLLRFPLWALRINPEGVASQLRRALHPGESV